MHLKRYLSVFDYLYILETFSTIRRVLVMLFGQKRRKIVEAKDKYDFSTSNFFINALKGQCQEGIKRKACTEVM